MTFFASCDSDKVADRTGSAASTTKPATGASAPTGVSDDDDDDDDDSGSEPGSATGDASGTDVGSGTEDAGGTDTGTGSGTEDATGSLNIDIENGGADPEANFTPEEMDDASAVAFLKSACASCHKDGAGNDSAWSMGAEANIVPEKYVARLKSDVQLDAVFAAMANKFLGIEAASPKPMPFGPTLDLELKMKLAGVLQWMKVQFPVSSAAGEERLGGLALDLKGPRVSKRYKCVEVPDKGAYLRRVMADIFDRPPTTSEKAKFYASVAEEGEPADAEYRKKVMNELFKPSTSLNTEFDRKGLEKLSSKITGVTGLRPNASYDADVIKDFQAEFLMLLRAKVKELPFKDILLAKKVMVSKKTAKFYSAACETAAANLNDSSTNIKERFVECDLDAERSNFFGTIPYLNLWQSSFLINNNNYTRMAHMYTVLTGEALKPKTDGPTGGAALPGASCLKSKDTRAKLANPDDPTSALAKHGTISIPSVGIFCQSCHVGRNLANGSIIFRPFHLHGEKLTKVLVAEAVTALNIPNPDPVPKFLEEVKIATEPGRVFVDIVQNKPKLVEVSSPDGLLRLAALLDKSSSENEGCVATVDPAGNKVEKKIVTIGDLTAEIVGDGKILIAGLARHIPRAFGNQSVTNQEILAAMSKANTEGGGKLYPLIRAYLETESYACGRTAEAPN